jgi:hypothetical protein
MHHAFGGLPAEDSEVRDRGMSRLTPATGRSWTAGSVRA